MIQFLLKYLTPVQLHLALYAIVVMVAMGGYAAMEVQTVRLRNAKAQMAIERQEWDTERLNAANARAVQEQLFRQKEQQWAKDREDEIDKTQTKLAQVERDRQRAVTASNQLQRSFTALATRSCGPTQDSPTSEGSSAASGPGLVLADVFSRTDRRAGELAAFADSSHAAGELCERLYDSLTKEANEHHPDN